MIRGFFRRKKENADGPSVYYLSGISSVVLLVFGILDSNTALIALAGLIVVGLMVLFLARLAWRSKNRIHILHALAFVPLVVVLCFVLYVLYSVKHIKLPMMG